MYASQVGIQDWGDLLVCRVFAWRGHVARMPVDSSRGLVDPDAAGCSGNARAELEALRVALRYRICPPVTADDAATDAFLTAGPVTSDSLFAINVVAGNF